jgi:hypothetical protein
MVVVSNGFVRVAGRGARGETNREGGIALHTVNPGDASNWLVDFDFQLRVSVWEGRWERGEGGWGV